MQSKKDLIKILAKEAVVTPQEELMPIQKSDKSLFIGIPKETSLQEKRVPLTPESVQLLTNNGHRIIIEANAGKQANFEDREYSEAGAKIAYAAKEVWQADIILKVAPPSLAEIEMMPGKQTLFSALQLTVLPKKCLKLMMNKRITAIAWDFIQDETGIYPIIRAMGEIAGNTSILIAAEYMSNANDGLGAMLGGISGVPPAEVVILGAGTVGEFAARSALGLGASVKIFDNSIYRLRRLQNAINVRLFTSSIQPSVLETALKTADVVIGALRSPLGRAPIVVTEDMVSKMKSGAVIVDVCIDQGGCIETSRVTSHENPTFKEYDVIHYCVPNIASRVSRTASYALSNIMAPSLIQTGNAGGIIQLVKHNSRFRHGVYLFRGTLTSEILAEAFELPYKDLDLLTTAL